MRLIEEKDSLIHQLREKDKKSGNINQRIDELLIEIERLEKISNEKDGKLRDYENKISLLSSEVHINNVVS